MMRSGKRYAPERFFIILIKLYARYKVWVLTGYLNAILRQKHRESVWDIGYIYKRLPNLAVSIYNILDCCQFIKAHWPTGVHFLGAYSDFGAEAELKAVGKSG